MGIPNASLVGILDSAKLSADQCVACLSPIELDESVAISNQRRRAEWLAGRIAAKFVFLERERSSASARSSGLRMRQITLGDLAGFSSETYREVVVTKDKSPAGGAPRIGWRSQGEGVRTAISHSNGLACAFIGDTNAYALDIEAPSPRIPAFYLRNFTPRERNWTGECARLFNLDPDWLYTLLWSAKECLLKTPSFVRLSLWNMPAIEINVVAGSERLAAVHQATGLSGNFEILGVETPKGLGPASHFQLAVGGTANLILAAITNWTETAITGGV
jgi:4'-phosphopantetheinyl transferase EntD